VSELGGFVGLGRVAARRQRVFQASVVSALVALLRGGSMALGGSFVVIGSSGVGFFGHLGFLCLFLSTSVPNRNRYNR
jgi:hypothetical protein